MTSTEVDGRWLDGVWYGAYNHYTVNCVERGGAGCTGWISPTLGARRCMHPRHDADRMSYRDAVALVERRVADGEATRLGGDRTGGEKA